MLKEHRKKRSAGVKKEKKAKTAVQVEASETAKASVKYWNKFFEEHGKSETYKAMKKELGADFVSDLTLLFKHY